MKDKIIILLLVIVVGSVVVLYGMVNVGYYQQGRAETSLESYQQKLGITSTSSFCNKDSDGDGYASCSYNDGKRIIDLECDSSLLFNTNGCKTPKNMFKQGN